MLPTMPDATQPPRRFPLPWTVEETAPCFIARDHNGQALAFVLTRHEAGADRGNNRGSKFYVVGTVAKFVREPGPHIVDWHMIGRLSRIGCNAQEARSG